MKIEWLIERDVGIIYFQQNPVKSDKTIKELIDSNFHVIITFADYDYSLSWREGSKETVRHYQYSLSDYPEPSDWELKHLNEYLLYEINHKRKIALWFENAQTEKFVKDSINQFFKYEDRNLSAFVKSKLATQRERVIDIPPKLTHCQACTEKGCITDLVCHVTSVTDAAKIIKSGIILSACKARRKLGRTLALEDRNAGGDPPDYFKYVPWEGKGYKPVGYGYDSIKANLDAIYKIVNKAGSLEARQAMIKEIDEKGIIATPANSSTNELVTEAARVSILNGGIPVEIVHGDNPHVKKK